MIGAFTSKQQTRRLNRPLETERLQIISNIIPQGASVWDVGAGPGEYVRWMREQGHNARGLDGTPDIFSISYGDVHCFDLSKRDQSPQLPIPPPRDWVLFWEVGEHIPKEFEEQVVCNVAHLAMEGIICSWATPGQRGRGHVNCLPASFVAEMFRRYGWEVHFEATALARGLYGKRGKEKILVLRKVHDG